MRRKIIPKTLPRSGLAVVSAGAQDRNSSRFSSCQKKKTCPNCRRSSSFKMNTVERRLFGSAKTKVDAQFELVFAELRTWSIRAMSVVDNNTPRKSNFKTQIRVGFSLTREGVALRWIRAVVAISPNPSLDTSRIASHGVGCHRFFCGTFGLPSQGIVNKHTLLNFWFWSATHRSTLGQKSWVQSTECFMMSSVRTTQTNPRRLVFTWWCLDRRCSSWSKSVLTQRGDLGGRGFDDGNDLTCSCSLHRRATRYAKRPQSSLTCHSANEFYGLPLVTRTCHT